MKTTPAADPPQTRCGTLASKSADRHTSTAAVHALRRTQRHALKTTGQCQGQARRGQTARCCTPDTHTMARTHCVDHVTVTISSPSVFDTSSRMSMYCPCGWAGGEAHGHTSATLVQRSTCQHCSMSAATPASSAGKSSRQRAGMHSSNSGMHMSDHSHWAGGTTAGTIW